MGRPRPRGARRALSATTWTVHRAGLPGALTELPIWLVLCGGYLVAVALLLAPWTGGKRAA